MKSKWAKIAVLVLVLLGFAAPVAVKVYENTVQPFTPIAATDIIAPTNAEVGELVRLTVNADQVEWRSLPEIPDSQVYGDNNEHFLCSFRRPGNYTVVAAILKDGELKVGMVTINVGGVANPTPTGPPVVAVTGLASQVQSWCTDSKVDKAVAAKMATNFAQTASEINSGKLGTTDAIIKRTAELNRSLDLDGFDTVMGGIQAEITRRADGGALSTPVEHAQVWAEIAQGLTNYSK